MEVQARLYDIDQFMKYKSYMIDFKLEEINYAKLSVVQLSGFWGLNGRDTYCRISYCVLSIQLNVIKTESRLISHGKLIETVSKVDSKNLVSLVS